MEPSKHVHDELRARYLSGDVPWDSPLPPPEVIAFAASSPPGRALDLGCGYGRTAIYLAEREWDVDGVDFVAEALDVARRRAQAKGVAVQFHLAAIPELRFLAPPYDLAVDVGCGHALESPGLANYHQELKRLLRPGALFLCFARIKSPGSPEASNDFEETDSPPGLDEGSFRRLFEDGFALRRYEPGITEMEDGSSWVSAWFWYQRQQDG